MTPLEIFLAVVVAALVFIAGSAILILHILANLFGDLVEETMRRESETSLRD
ncbi:hypothetical protein [Microcystis phage Mwe-JY26]